MNKKRVMTFTTVGGSSILTIFAVLCFIVFALLTLSTAKADRILADRSVSAVEKYYEADAEAEAILAKLRSGVIPESVKNEGNRVYSFACPIGTEEELRVEIQMKNKKIEILRWQKVYVGKWKTDDSIEVWGGTEITE